MKVTLIISILSVFALALLILMLVFHFTIWKHKKLFNNWKKTLQQIPVGQFQRCQSTLNRIDIIARANPQYQKVHQKLGTIYDDINREVRDLESIKNQLAFSFNNKKINPVIIKAQLAQLQGHNSGIQKMFHTFFTIAKQVTYQDEFMRNEFAFYQKHLRQVDDLSAHILKITPEINSPVQVLKSQLRALEKEYELVVRAANVEKANQILRKYTTKVLKLITIINEGQAINATLNYQLPQAIKKLNLFYQRQYQKLTISLTHIAFLANMKNISRQMSKAHQYFKTLQFDKTKNKIKEIFKKFKTLEFALNSEILARRQVINNYQLLLIEVENLLTFWKSNESKNENFLANLKMPISNYQNNYQHLKIKQKQLDKHKVELSRILKDTNLAYSQKLQKLEDINNFCILLGQEMNEFQENLQRLYNQEINTQNSILRCDAMLNQIIANYQKYHLQLTSEQKEKLQFLLLKRNQFLQAINSQALHSLVGQKKLETFKKEVIAFYQITGAQIHMAFKVQQILKTWAPQRANNSQINFALTKAEQNYLSGSYAFALNNIIKTMPRQKIRK